jgi:hypothetical protein
MQHRQGVLIPAVTANDKIPLRTGAIDGMMVVGSGFSSLHGRCCSVEMFDAITVSCMAQSDKTAAYILISHISVLLRSLLLSISSRNVGVRFPPWQTRAPTLGWLAVTARSTPMGVTLVGMAQMDT